MSGRASMLRISRASIGIWGWHTGIVARFPIVPNTIVRLLSNDKDVLKFFADNPFPQAPPRALLWQYWFTSTGEKINPGMWWKRQMVGDTHQL